MTNDTGPKPTRAKKSETPEVRIPYDTKQAFLSACREDGTTASEVVRDKVQEYLDARERPSLNEEKRTLVMKLPQPVRRYGLRVAAGSAIAVGFVGMAALPSAAAPDFKAQFGRLDANGDGVLSVEEFLGPKVTDASGSEERKIVIESRVTTTSDAPEAKPQVSLQGTAQMQSDAFTFWLPEELGGTKDPSTAKPQQQEFKFISRHEVKDGEPDAGASASHTLSFSLEDIRKEEFASIDTDGDGRVSLPEYQARQTAMLTRGFEILDVSGDGALTEEEYGRIVAPPMARVHVSGHGMPEAPEMPKIEIPGMKSVGPEAIKAAFTRLDINKDAKLSLQEYLPAS